MAVCLVIVGGIVAFVGTLTDDDEVNINAKDIKEISFLDDNDMVIGSTKNTEVINNSISLLLDTDSLDDYVYTYNIKTKVNGSMYKFTIYTTKDNYDYINNILINDKEFMKGFSKYKNNSVFAIEYIDGYTGIDNNNLSDMIVNKYKNDKNIFGSNTDDGLFDVSLYIYDNFNVRNIEFNVSGDKNLELGILRYYNNNTKKMFNKLDNENSIYSYYIDNHYCSYDNELYKEISKFIIDNIDDDIDINKEYDYIRIYSNNGTNVFITNKIDKLNELKSKISFDDIAEYGGM